MAWNERDGRKIPSVGGKGRVGETGTLAVVVATVVAAQWL